MWMLKLYAMKYLLLGSAEFHLTMRLPEDLELGGWLSSLEYVSRGKLEIFFEEFSYSWEPILWKD